ncbi:hypothetical protein [Myxococcus hansupus]|uniref:hypothetical protein n=1 Tax=Pseudomyxococcus hansupus TaxID=1297742 RepID=UPI000272F817|nr:hypothetical protein [Myxococcus hansupus]
MSPRIDRRTPTAVAPTSRQGTEQPLARQGADAATSGQVRTQRNADGFQPNVARDRATTNLNGRQPITPQAPVTARPLTPSEVASVNQVLQEATNSRDPSVLVNFLRDNPDPAMQAALMDNLFAFGPVAGQILDKAGRLSAADQQVLSSALDTAFRSGAVTVEELTAGVGSHGRGSWGGETHEGLAKIVAGTGNPELITAYAQREMQIMSDGNTPDPARSVAVATALAGLPPEQLQDFLKNNPDGIGKVLGNLNNPIISGGTGALGGLLDAASAIKPPTQESLKLFLDSIQQVGTNPESRAAAARFFMEHSDAILSGASDLSGSVGSASAGRLSEFFTRTLFTEPPFEGQDALRSFVNTKLGDMRAALETQANANPPSQETQRLARSMGSLLGAIEGGFLLSVEELKKNNEAAAGLAGLIFKLKDVIPTSSIPGLGQLQNLTLGQIEKWVTDAVQRDPDKARDAIPFHRLFGEQITNPTLRSIYDAARLTSLEDRRLGLSN